MDYQSGKIYAIRNHVNNKVYVGSTTQTLSQRMARHRYDCVRDNPRISKMQLYIAIAELGVENFYIELIETYPCESKEKLTAREGYWIRANDSFSNGYNGRIEGRTAAEYYCDNVEREKERHRHWQEKNCEKLMEKNECECGGKYTHSNRAVHFKTQKHQRYLQSLEQAEVELEPL